MFSRCFSPSTPTSLSPLSSLLSPEELSLSSNSETRQQQYCPSEVQQYHCDVYSRQELKKKGTIQFYCDNLLSLEELSKGQPLHQQSSELFSPQEQGPLFPQQYHQLSKGQPLHQQSFELFSPQEQGPQYHQLSPSRSDSQSQASRSLSPFLCLLSPALGFPTPDTPHRPQGNEHTFLNIHIDLRRSLYI